MDRDRRRRDDRRGNRRSSEPVNRRSNKRPLDQEQQQQQQQQLEPQSPPPFPRNSGLGNRWTPPHLPSSSKRPATSQAKAARAASSAAGISINNGIIISGTTTKKSNNGRRRHFPLSTNAVESMVLGTVPLSPVPTAAIAVAAAPSSRSTGGTEESLQLTNQQQIIVRLYLGSLSDKADSDAARDESQQQPRYQQDMIAMEATISDGTCHMPVLVLHTDSTLAMFDAYQQEGCNDFTILVEGYVTTDYYATSTKSFFKFKVKPCVTLVSFKVLRRKIRTRKTRPGDLGIPLEEYLSTQASLRAAVQDVTGADILNNNTNNNNHKISDTNSYQSLTQQQHHSSHISASARVQSGNAGSFLKQRAPFLTNEELAGDSVVALTRWGVEMSETTTTTTTTTTGSGCTTTILSEDFNDNVLRVSNFLAQHVAMMTLQSAAAAAVNTSSGRSTPIATAAADSVSPTTAIKIDTSEDRANNSASASAASVHSADLSDSATTLTSTSATRPTEQTVCNYTAALKEFSSSQFDRQRASLLSNSGREAADRASLVMERYKATLECALNDEEATSLTIPLLCSWHAMLLKGLHPDAGQIRSKTVRAGNTYFTPPDQIVPELEALCQSLESLQARMSLSSTSKSSSSDTKHAIVYVAGAMFGVVDIHPFSDGNGRLCRIVANWALKKVARVPFPVNLFATPAQRADYVLALQQITASFSVRPWGGASRDELLLAIKCTGVFFPLVRLLMDRLARASDECLRVWGEKSLLATEAAEARVARRARELSAQGTCLICFDSRPNIATLCCGKAIHLNCIAEWLGNNGTCPVCRSELPSISGRVVQAASSGVAGEAGTLRRRYRQFRADGEEEDEDEEDMQPGVSDDGTVEEGASEDDEGDDDDDQQGSAEDTTATSSNDDDDDDDDEDDNIMALAAQLQRQIQRQRGVDVGRAASLEIARRLLSAVSRETHADAEEGRSGTTEDGGNDDDDNDDDDHERAIEDQDTTEDATSQEDDDDNTTAAAASSRQANDEDEDTTEDTNPTEDTATTSVQGGEGSADESTMEDDTTRSAASPPPAPAASSNYCVSPHCRNKPAADCSNRLCGRCCVLTGTYYCSRHNC